MAELKSPLLSLKAKGKLANTLVFSSWKGKSVVKSKVDPSNPNTAGQQAERTAYGQCIQDYRESDFNQYDLEALRRSLRKDKISGTTYNFYVKQCIDCKNVPEDWRKCHGIYLMGMFHTNPTVKIEGDDSKTLNLYWGTAPYNLVDKGAMTPSGGNWQKGMSGLVVGTRYYFAFVGDGVLQSALYSYICGNWLN